MWSWMWLTLSYLIWLCQAFLWQDVLVKQTLKMPVKVKHNNSIVLLLSLISIFFFKHCGSKFQKSTYIFSYKYITEFPTWIHAPTTRNRRSMLHLSLSSGRASSRSSMKALLYFITWNSLYRRKSLIKIRSHQWLTVWLLTQLEDSQDSVMSFIRNSASVYFSKSISNRGKICKKKFFVFHCSKYCQFGNHFFKI